MKIKINITKEILKESMYCTSFGIELTESMIGQNCAIGKAIFNLFGKRSWVGANGIFIFEKEVLFMEQNKHFGVDINSSKYFIPLPGVTKSFIRNFDGSHPTERIKMPPFSFEIDVPDALIDEIGINQVHDILQNTHSLDLVK